MMIGRFLYLALLIAPIVEIAVFALIAQAIGFWSALAGVLLLSLLGAAMVSRQGLSLLAEIRTTIGAGRMPARALADAMLVGIAGLLLLVPGYVTDVAGLLLLVPPLRFWLYRFLARRMGIDPATGRGAPPSRPKVIELDSNDFRSP
jgi:UPF0716 protein FxsA